MNKKVLVNFASNGFYQAQKVQCHNFRKLHPEGEIYVFSEKALDEFKSLYPIVGEGRGFGFWTFKYLLLRKVMREVCSVGDTVLYLDSGCTPVRKLDKLFDLPGDINLFMARSPQYTWDQLTMKQWCKADCWKHFSVTDPLDETNVLCGGYQMYRVGEDAFKFLDAICDSMKLPQLWNDEPSIQQNQEGFIEHRHDQSVLTSYVHSSTRQNHNITITRFPNQENMLAGEVDEKDMCVILHRCRDHRAIDLTGLILC